MVHQRQRLSRSTADLAGQNLHLDARPDKVLAAVHKPLNSRNDEDNPERSHTVVWRAVSQRWEYSTCHKGCLLTHVAAGSRQVGWEKEENRCQSDIDQRDLE
jgi:hypothetical protein